MNTVEANSIEATNYLGEISIFLFPPPRTGRTVNILMRICAERQVALAQGVKKYFTGKPCKKSHVSDRFTATTNCVECSRESSALRRLQNAPPKYDPLRRKFYHLSNRDKVLAQMREYSKSHPVNKSHPANKSCYYKDYARKYQRHRKQIDLNFRIAANLRTRLCNAVKNDSKTGSAVTDLGCSVGFLRTWIENQFNDGMTWKNWSRKGWHIDHIRPLASFDLSDRNQLLEATHYTNLRPLWSIDNIRKGAR